MLQLRASRIALALAPILALMACDQIGGLFGSAPSGPGPAAMSSVPIEARAVSGSVEPQAEVAALLAPEPLMIAPGEILVGARVEQQLATAASQMGLAGSLVSALRSQGDDALDSLSQGVMAQVRARAEATASETARNNARLVLQRLGIEGEINITPGGLVTVDLTPRGGRPTSLNMAQDAAGAAAPAAEPLAVVWDPNATCPARPDDAALDANLALRTRCAIQRLTASRQFDFVEPNYIGSVDFDRLPWNRARETPPPSSSGSSPSTPAQAGGVPNDPLYALQWDMRPRGQGAGRAPGGAGFVNFWQAHQVGSRNVRVAVIDTGLETAHPDIRNSRNVARGIDLITSYDRAGDSDGVDNDANDVGDRCGTATENSYHGTHVAGTIGAVMTNDRVGVAGGAWDVTIVPIRVLGRCGGELADIVSGIRWAAGLAPAVAEDGTQLANPNPADIINMSLSIGAPCPASMQSAINDAVARNVVIVVAAGNRADNANNSAPANCQNVIVVASNNEVGTMAFYSNFGPAVDILAPGGDIYNDSDGDGRPDGILSSRTSATNCYDPANNGATGSSCYYGFLQGTSMAAPHVTAALALLAAQTGLRGSALEDALFTRALGPIEASQREVNCAQYPRAIPISGRAGVCDRPAGRGMLDMARAAASIAVAAPAAAPGSPGAQRRRR